MSDLEFPAKSLRQNSFFVDDMSHFLYVSNLQPRIKCLKSALKPLYRLSEYFTDQFRAN